MRHDGFQNSHHHHHRQHWCHRRRHHHHVVLSYKGLSSSQLEVDGA